MTHKVTKQEQKVNKVVQNARLLAALFGGAKQDVIPPEPARLVNVLERRVRGL